MSKTPWVHQCSHSLYVVIIVQCTWQTHQFKLSILGGNWLVALFLQFLTFIRSNHLGQHQSIKAIVAWLIWHSPHLHHPCVPCTNSRCCFVEYERKMLTTWISLSTAVLNSAFSFEQRTELWMIQWKVIMFGHSFLRRAATPFFFPTIAGAPSQWL